MTEHFWQSLKQSVDLCAKAYSHPTHTFENESVVITETDVVTVAIAGSDDVYDWLQNFNRTQKQLGKWKVSEGFLNAAKNVMAILDEYRANKPQSYVKPLVFTGHSKGGAVAIVCGMLSVMRHNTVERVTTFAAPRITMQKINLPFGCDQVEAKGDPVTKLPTWTPWRRWRHNGRTISIGKQTTADIGREWFGWFSGSVKKHLIANYLEVLQ
jgi:hypothetical protein